MIVGRRQGEHTEKAFVEVSILGRCLYLYLISAE